MNCTNCNGVGLTNKTQEGIVYGQEVCPECHGTGGDAPTAFNGIEIVVPPKTKQKK